MITAQVGTKAPEAANQNRDNETPAHRTRSQEKNGIIRRGARRVVSPDGYVTKLKAPGSDSESETETGNLPGDELEDDGDNGKMDISEFIETYKDAIAQKVTEAYAPRYQPGQPGQDKPLPALVRKPMGAQEHAVRGTALSLEVNPGTIIVGEMGTGKTYIGAAAAHMAGFRNILVLVPPHLVYKWKREIEMTVPRARAAIVRTITDVKRLTIPAPSVGPRFTIMSRETAKLSYRWQAAYITRLPMTKYESKIKNCCPECFEQILDKDGLPVSTKEIEKKKMQCGECGGALWQPKQEEHTAECACRKCGGTTGSPIKYRNRKYALADYIKKRKKNFFDLLICDEVHEYKARGSAQGIAGGNLAQACGKVLTLTGTLAGGYSSTLFYLLYRFTPEIRNDFKHNEQGRWIDRYGFRQRKYRSKDGADEPFEHGRGSGRRAYRQIEKETPGLAPAALFHIIGNTVFLRLSDVSSELPPYEEMIQVQQMSRKVAPGAQYSQKTAYEKLYLDLKSAMTTALSRGSTRLLAAYLQSLLAFPDGCTRGEKVVDPKDDSLIVSIPPLAQDETYPKEQALIDLVLEEKKAGRRVLIYTTHTDTRDLTGRIEQFLNREGIRTQVLKSVTVKSENREEWVGRKVREGLDALICNPRLVQTGLDLVDFPTICWFETDYSVYTMRQASRRSWRIGQTRPVKVMFMVYEKTIQTEALKLVAKKMQSSLAVEGELPEEGLIAFGDDGQDLIMTLPDRSSTRRSSNPATRWRTSSPGRGKQSRRRSGIWSDDEWHTVKDTADAADKPPKPAQKTIFSWRDFQAQALQPKGRHGKRNPPGGKSMFDWAEEHETDEADEAPEE